MTVSANGSSLPASAPEREAHLSDYLGILLRRWKVAALAFAVVLTGTLIYNLTATPLYEAAGTLQVRKAAQKSVTRELGLEADNILPAEIEVLQSRSLAEDVARRFNGGRDPDGGLVNSVRGSLRISEVGAKGSGTLRISSVSTDPARARDIVNHLIDAYVAGNIEAKTGEAAKTVDFISEQLAGMADKLDNSEQALQEYKVQTGLVTLGPEGGSLVGKVVGLEQQRTDISLRRQRVEYAIGALQEALRKGSAFTPPVIEGAGPVAPLAARLGELEAERKSLLVNYTAAHPAVIEKDAAIRRVLEAMLSAYQSVRQELQLAERDAYSKIAGYDAQLKEVPEAELELARRTRINTVNAQLYNFLLQKQQEARIAQASTLSSVSVVDRAQLPGGPFKPNKSRNLAIGTAFGLLLGLGLVYLLDYMDQTIKSADDVRDKLGLALFGRIPRIPLADEDARLPGRQLVTTLAPKSPAVEAFRALRTNLSYLTGRESHKVIMLTSTLPGEGKSTVSGNLAAVLSQTGAKVLLIGCDLRRPSLYAMFSEHHEPGLTDLLVHGDHAGLRRIEEPRLDLLPAGKIPPNPAEILASEGFRQFLATAREKYDYVVIDAPPVLPVTDAQILGPLVDVTLLVIEPCRIPERALHQVIESLAAVDVKVSGAILNDKTGKGFKYYGYYGYYGYKAYRGYYGESSRHLEKDSALKKAWDKLNG